MSKHRSLRNQWRQSSLRTQIIVAFAVIGFAATLLNAVLIGIFLKNYIVERQGNQMVTQSQALSRCCGNDTTFLLQAPPQTLASLMQATLADSTGRYVLLIDAHGHLIYASPQLSASLRQMLLAHARLDFSHTPSSQPRWQLVGNQIIADTSIIASSPSIENPQAQPTTLIGELLLTENQSITSQLWRRFLGLVLIAAFATLFLVLLGTLFAAQTLTRPIRAMTETTQAIAEGDYHRRVSPAGPQEFHALSLSFNHMVTMVLQQQQVERDLIANVSHELAAPLGLIRGYAEALIDGIIADEPQRFDILHAISAETTRLGRLSGDLLDLAMLETGQIAMHSEPVPIADLLTALYNRFATHAQQVDVAMKLELAPDLPIIETDGLRLEQVLVNLMNNALRYTSPCGTITLRATTRGNEVVVSVADTGSGIPADALERIWERFYQVDEGRDRREWHSGTAGVGLGLAVCRSIVTLLKGRIGVESAVGQGTTFTISLPSTNC